MLRFILLFCFQILFIRVVFAQKPELTAGPMPGYIEHKETVIWLQTKNASSVKLVYWLLADSNSTHKHLSQTKLVNPNVTSEHHFILTQLHMGATYGYRIELNKKAISFPYPLRFATKPLWEWRTNAPDFTFITGSCLYVNDSAYDRPGKPYGQQSNILSQMADYKAAFMLWLGDNVYTREADYGSESGLAYRYFHTRSYKPLQPLLASKNHYAIWDDHDYGSNDACLSYPLKYSTLNLFKSYWANKTYGNGKEGIYSQFSFADADFFLLDDRFFRDYQFLNDSLFPDKTQLGEEQFRWLCNALSYSRATFKFIAIGGQFLNEYTDKESYNFYKKERERILNFITKQKVSGVIFLTGDRHHTELLKNTALVAELGYAPYDLTSSAISSKASDISKSAEFKNPMRVDGTLVMENNFCALSITGARGKRLLTITCLSAEGKILWEQQIPESALKASQP
ncbi:MAG: alkaline phosphatase family protein [Bacteroidia bacterium]|jgi:alkaline phosphatase D|nr:alkaline phosphatase family protein [Bacteroidia bacterium]